MKTQKITYWVSTSLFAAMMLMASVMYLTSPEIAEKFAQIGFTSQSFRIELAIAKFAGAICLLLPAVKGNLKEWVYAGFAIIIVSALTAHVSIGDGNWTGPLMAGVFLTLSYVFYHKLQRPVVA